MAAKKYRKKHPSPPRPAAKKERRPGIRFSRAALLFFRRTEKPRPAVFCLCGGDFISGPP
ncbi:MAG TPA: hypothetical protein DD433_01645 [Ruminococcaceae bacterium]|nr:hypothetical protein [Oscillospiraceae bacterium]